MSRITDLEKVLFKKKSPKDREKLINAYLSKKNSTLNTCSTSGYTLLTRAVREQDQELAELLCKYGADPNGINQAEGSTPLMWAAQSGNRALVYFLLHQGARVEIRDVNRDNAMGWAFKAGHFTLSRIISLHVPDAQGHTMMMRAIALQYYDLVPLLLQEGQDINAQDAKGNTPLMLAVLQNAKEMVMFLLSEEADLEIENEDQQSAYTLAVAAGYNDIAQWLSVYQMARHADAQEDNLLMIAARAGYEEILAYLLNTEVEINAQNQAGDTALLLAIQEGHYKAVLLLLAKGADLEIANNKGHTPLVVAARQGYKNLVELLLSKGAKIWPNSLSLLYKHEKIKKLIMQYQMIGLAIEDGDTPLMRAVQSGYLDVARIWVAKNSDLNATDFYNKTALQQACNQWFRNQEIELLLRSGASITPDTSEATYLKSKMLPLLECCLEEGDLVSALRVLNTAIESYKDAQWSAQAYAQIRSYFLNKSKKNWMQKCISYIKDYFNPERTQAREAARRGEVYSIEEQRLAYETLISGVVQHTAPDLRNALIMHLFKDNRNPVQEELKKHLSMLHYANDAHLQVAPLVWAEQVSVAKTETIPFSIVNRGDPMRDGESAIGLAWKAQVAGI